MGSDWRVDWFGTGQRSGQLTERLKTCVVAVALSGVNWCAANGQPTLDFMFRSKSRLVARLRRIFDNSNQKCQWFLLTKWKFLLQFFDRLAVVLLCDGIRLRCAIGLGDWEPMPLAVKLSVAGLERFLNSWFLGRAVVIALSLEPSSDFCAWRSEYDRWQGLRHSYLCS